MTQNEFEKYWNAHIVDRSMIDVVRGILNRKSDAIENASEISADDEWMKEEVWDDIYEEDKKEILNTFLYKEQIKKNKKEYVTVSELIEYLQILPQDYIVTFDDMELLEEYIDESIFVIERERRVDFH